MHRDLLLSQLKKYREKISNLAAVNYAVAENQLLLPLKQYAITELDNADKIIAFVASNHNCFERELPQGHVTGSSWLLNTTADKVLLTHHRKLGIWVQLGGHADGNPDILAVSLQEAKEESGINSIVPIMEDIFDIDIHLIPPHKGVPEHYHYDIRYVLKVADNSNFIVSPESIDLAWVGVATIANSVEFNDSLCRMAHKWLAAF